MPFLRRVLAVLVGFAIGLPLLLFLAQDSLIFHPRPAPQDAPRGQGIEEVVVPVGDGLVLSGWLARAPGNATGRAPLLIYFGGNAEEVSHMSFVAARLAPWSVLAVNYRGYGGNPGKPGERELLADALAIYDWAARRPDVDPVRIVPMGRSLGSGVAVHVAAGRRVAGVVLVTPYDSLRAVAQGIYPFVPVSLLLRHSFDSMALAPAITVPMLAVVAGRDEVIPPSHARRLFNVWGGPRQWRELPAAGHNSISLDPAYWESVRTFLIANSQ